VNVFKFEGAKDDDETRAFVKKTIGTLKAIDSPAMVRIHDSNMFSAFGSTSCAYIVFDTLSGAIDLSWIIDRVGHISAKSCRTIFDSIFAAIAQMHQSGFAHTEIRTQNILVG